MTYFLYKLTPPRPTFPGDMTPAEGILMREHVGYWAGLMKQGRVLAFGPVADPKGSYGIGIIQLEDGYYAGRPDTPAYESAARCRPDRGRRRQVAGLWVRAR